MAEVLRWALWALSSVVMVCIGLFLVLAILCTFVPHEDQDREGK